jgi:hypothetical protein
VNRAFEVEKPQNSLTHQPNLNENVTTALRFDRKGCANDLILSGMSDFPLTNDLQF